MNNNTRKFNLCRSAGQDQYLHHNRQYLTSLTLILVCFFLFFSKSSLATIIDVVNRIETKVVAVSTKVTNQAILTRSSVKNVASAISDQIDELPSIVQQNLGVVIPAETKAQLLDGIKTVDELIKISKEQIDSFTPEQCSATKTLLKGLLSNITDFNFSYTQIIRLPKYQNKAPTLFFDASLLDTDALVDKIPCPTIVSIYLLNVNVRLDDLGILDCLKQLILAVNNALPTLEPILNNSYDCKDIIALNNQYSSATTILSGVGKALSFIGGLLEPKHELTGNIKEFSIGIHGYPQLTVELAKPVNFLAKTTTKLGAFSSGVSAFVLMNVRHCEVTEGQKALLQEMCSLSRYRSENCQALLNQG